MSALWSVPSIALALAAAALAGCAGAGAGASAADEPARVDVAAERRAVEAVLDELHAAASRADGASYFALFAEDAVFLGTDATERWDLAAFRAYAEPYFARGQGWTYAATERHVSLSPRGDVAWFDERLDNAKYGEVRGSGALVREAGAWRIAQYNLAFPVPNELADELVERIRRREAPKGR